MKRKLTILMFGLLLAVGWTSDASAQKLYLGKPWYQSAFFQRMMQPTMTVNSKVQATELTTDKQSAVAEGIIGQTSTGKMSKAPMRANYNQTAPVTHIKSWYDGKHYNWYDAQGNLQGSPSYTEAVTDTCQMFWFIRSLYADPEMPGIKYSEAQNVDLAYDGCDFGYWLSGDVAHDIVIGMNSNCYITAIYVYSWGGDLITSYDADDGATPPNGWWINSSSMTRTYENVSSTQRWYYWKMTSNNVTDFEEAFEISKDLLAGYGGVYVYVVARNTSSTANRTNTYQIWHYDYNHQGYYALGENHLMDNTWRTSESIIHGPVTPPAENGYSVVLVKLKDDFDYTTDWPVPFTLTDSALYSYYNKHIDELQLLTDGLRVNENTANAGTLFAYSGEVNKFFYISKGKTYQISGSENAWRTYNNEYQRYADNAPFYHMYEEFSPYVDAGTEDHSDFYEKLRQGVTYPVVHDCNSVIYWKHFFAMSGDVGTSENRVNSLVLYIPDQRGQSDSRTYEEAHQPTVGMYIIDLYADIEPSETEPDTYIATVTWFDNLGTITHSDGIPQTYYLYQIIGNDTIPLTPNGTTDTSWTGPYDVEDDAYDVHYFVVGVPTAATNPDTFFAQSNTDDVTVPGKNDFIGLQWWRYESDYVAKNVADPTNNEVNYYRNWLAPHKLSTQGQGGISAGNVGTNGRTLTLYREDEPIIDLELVMNGNKAYYRIKYRDAQNNQQIEPGYGADGEVDPNYNPNNN